MQAKKEVLSSGAEDVTARDRMETVEDNLLKAEELRRKLQAAGTVLSLSEQILQTAEVEELEQASLSSLDRMLSSPGRKKRKLKSLKQQLEGSPEITKSKSAPRRSILLNRLNEIDTTLSEASKVDTRPRKESRLRRIWKKLF